MYDLAEGNLRNLSNLGVPSHTYSKLLVHLLIEKIQHSLHLVTSREFDDEVWELENIKIFQKGAFCKGTLRYVS